MRTSTHNPCFAQISNIYLAISSGRNCRKLYLQIQQVQGKNPGDD